MINRALIRLKIVQLVYAYYQNEGKTTEVALKEVEFSLQKSYDLYRMLLLFLVGLRERAVQRETTREARMKRLGTPSVGGNDKVIIENRFLTQLAENKELKEFAEKQKVFLTDDENLVKKIYDLWINDELFQSYVDDKDKNYDTDREIVRKLYKTHIVNNENFDALLEEQSLYWNDDKEIVDSFVMKTIKRFDPTNGADQPLLPAYAADEDPAFAARLFTVTIARAEELRDLIRANTKNWEFSRLAFMDLIIMQIMLAEIMEFDQIPLNVSFNEYLDIAKVYSTPRSSSYIHGMVDNIVKKLRADGVIFKDK